MGMKTEYKILPSKRHVWKSDKRHRGMNQKLDIWEPSQETSEGNEVLVSFDWMGLSFKNIKRT